MKKNRLSFEDGKRISITDYLSHLGFEPARIRGIDYWYHSPFREDRTPSFKVNTRSNVWFDHGTGEGGTILDLGAKLHRCSVVEFVRKLSEGNYISAPFGHRQFPADTPSRLEVVSVNPLTNKDLVDYLASRCIDIETARRYCFEVKFMISPRIYTAVGFPNQSGGYELRNRWFKGSSSPKDISLIATGSKNLSILEGFLDFLSVFKVDIPEIKETIKNSDFVVLNSLAMLSRTLPIIQTREKINLILDNDLAARNAQETLREKGVQFRDLSILFSDNKDLNEYVVARAETKRPFPEQNRSSGIRP